MTVEVHEVRQAVQVSVTGTDITVVEQPQMVTVEERPMQVVVQNITVSGDQGINPLDDPNRVKLGTVTLASGISHLDYTFPAPFQAAPGVVLITMLTPAGGTALATTVSQISTTGFRVDFSDAVPDDGRTYALQYLAIGGAA